MAMYPRLKELLRSINSLHEHQREHALQRALGVSDADALSRSGAASDERYADEDRKALRALAEAVEAAVRGGQKQVLGLDWGD